ncbi:MAG: alpha-amylase family glycosyl hydrolase [Bacteroidota bacterium]
MRLRLLLLWLLVLGVAGCDDSAPGTPDRSAPTTVGLFSPVQLRADSTTIFLADYFPLGEWPDTLLSIPELKLLPDSAAGTVTLVPKGEALPWLATLDLEFGAYSYSILLKRSRKRKVLFALDPQGATYQTVQLAGEFNGWNPANSPMVLRNGVWQNSVVLDPGRYQYQVVRDGNWSLDPTNPDSVDNNLGGYNSLKIVGNPRTDMVTAETRIIPYTGDSTAIRVQYLVDITAGAPDERRTPRECFAFWENTRISASPGAGGDTYDFRWTIPIPDTARTRERSHIRAWFRSATGYYNDILIPLEYGRPVRDPAQLRAADQHRNVLYFPMVDRFHDGDSTINAPLADPRVHPKANYHGGDLAGVIEKLEAGWFDSLGINTLWLSPIVRNPDSAFKEWPEPRRWFSGYHGYWPVASTQVDPRFGDAGTLERLIEVAHARDIKVLLDFVANHVHQDNPMYRNHPEWATALYLADSTINVRIWEEQRLTTWFDVFLPSLDFSRPEVIEAQVDTAIFWLNRYAVDGFRHDATKHIPVPFWRQLARRIKQEVILKQDRPLFQIGETIASRELIGDYVGSGLLDGQFDFNLYFDTRRIFAAADASVADLESSVMASLTAYGHHHLMGSFGGNHDMPRFISLAGGALRMDEDAQAAGWAREIGVGDTLAYRKQSMYTAFLTAIPGVPVLYYGEEIGLPGAGDPDNRRDMRFANLTDLERRTLDQARRALRIRTQFMAPLYGETEFARRGRHGLTVIRSYLGESVIYAFNLSLEPLVLNLGSTSGKRFGMLESNFGGGWRQVERGYGELTLGGWSFEILTPVAQ